MTTAKFEFGEAPGSAPNTIKGMHKLDPFLVKYIDGAGKEQVRIGFKTEESDSVFILQERIQGVNVAVNANPWFRKAFKKMSVEPDVTPM